MSYIVEWRGQRIESAHLKANQEHLLNLNTEKNRLKTKPERLWYNIGSTTKDLTFPSLESQKKRKENSLQRYSKT